MSANRLFYPAGMDVQGTYLSQVGDQEQRTNFDDLTEFASGDPAPSWTGTRKFEPQFNVETTAVSSVLLLCTPASGSDYIALSTASGDVKLFFRQARDQHIRFAEADSSHVVYTMTSNSMLYWDQIKASQDREATISVECHATDNQVNDPLTRTASQTITTAPIVASMFTLGPVYINGAQLQGIQSMTWANNITVDKISADGDTSPTLIVIKQYRPVITIETLDLQTLANYNVEGNAVTTFDAYLRARKRTMINYDDSEEAHIKLAGTKGMYRVTRTSGEQSAGTVEIALERPSAGGYVFTTTTATAIGGS